MPQQLQVFKQYGADAKSVPNVKPTTLETLQNALDREAARRAAAMQAGSPTNLNANDVVENRPAPSTFGGSTVNAATPLDGSRLGLTSVPRQAAAVTAINGATTPGSAYRMGWGSPFQRQDYLSPGVMRAPSPGSNMGMEGVRGGSNRGNYDAAPVMRAPVRIASGKTVAIGSRGAHGGVVQADGSVVNEKTGRMMAAAPGKTKDGTMDFMTGKTMIGGSWW